MNVFDSCYFQISLPVLSHTRLRALNALYHLLLASLVPEISNDFFHKSSKGLTGANNLKSMWGTRFWCILRIVSKAMLLGQWNKKNISLAAVCTKESLGDFYSTQKGGVMHLCQTTLSEWESLWKFVWDEPFWKYSELNKSRCKISVLIGFAKVWLVLQCKTSVVKGFSYYLEPPIWQLPEEKVSWRKFNAISVGTERFWDFLVRATKSRTWGKMIKFKIVTGFNGGL